MKILLKNHFENAFEALKANKGRTVLTLSGIIIGVASITVVLSLAGGLNRFIGYNNIRTDKPVASVRSDAATPTIDTLFAGGVTHVNTLTEKDAADLSKINSVTAAPIAFLTATVSTSDGKTQLPRTAIIGSTEQLQAVADLQMFDGQFVNGIKGIVLGYQLSIDLFGTEHSIGSVVNVHDEKITVVGVLKEVKQPSIHLPFTVNNSAILPLSVSKKLTQNTAQIQQIIMTAPEQSQLEAALGEAKQILSKNHFGNEDYRVLLGDEINEQYYTLINIFSVIMAIIASVSLLVGGVGIMNVMLVHVAERRREVGIRRAVGATSYQIVNQFLVEAAIIGFVGGGVGYLVGTAGIFIVNMYVPLTPYIHWQTAALVIALSVIIGILAGIYPALRAAKRDPIESLRY